MMLALFCLVRATNPVIILDGVKLAGSLLELITRSYVKSRVSSTAEQEAHNPLATGSSPVPCTRGQDRETFLYVGFQFACVLSFVFLLR